MGMSSAVIKATCDAPGCTALGPDADTPGQAKTLAYFAGWKITPYPSSGALCPTHRPVEEDD